MMLRQRRVMGCGGSTLWIAALVMMIATTGAVAQVDRGEPATPDEALALGPEVADLMGPPHGNPVSGDLLDQQTDELTSRMRCPVCQGHAVVDSPSETARNMKRQVRAMIAAGYDEPQIFHYFEASYGEFVRLIPRAEGFNLLVWIVPLLGLLVGGMVVLKFLRRGKTPSETTGAEETDSGSPPVDGDLDPWIAQVRQQVDGKEHD